MQPAKTKRFFLGPDWHGIAGSLVEALSHNDAPEHKPSDYEAISREEYENTVLDFRFEDGRWTQ